MKRIGVDTGGTFTDCVLWDDATGLVASAKVSSDNADPARAVMAGVDKLAPGEDFKFLLHGTTVATNATLERSGPRIGLICTAGFRDILEIARLTRPPEQLYNLQAKLPEPLIKRRDRLEVSERLDRHGRIIKAIDTEEVVRAVRTLALRGIESVAVCLMHAYANGEHERAVRDVICREIPGAVVSLSSEVLPEFREYERSSTTALNAYLAPVVGGYLKRLQDAVSKRDSAIRLWVMQSNGGVASVERAAQLPVSLLLSGPSGGVVASRYLMDQAGIGNGITIDMGGTSFDVCLLPDDGIPTTQERRVMDMPIKVPSVDILTIGSGGGSIGWVDGAEQFRVGPQSAGASPGPACYGRGGEEPTVTDANLVLGILGPDQRLGGEVALNFDLAAKACERLGRKLGLSAREAAWGIRRLVNANMAGATRAVSVGRGYDPRDFSLIAFGGAGPLHAIDIASELDIPRTVVPAVPGCLCALGLVVSDVTHDYVTTHLAHVVPGLEPIIDGLYKEMVKVAQSNLSDEGITIERQELFPSIEMRYVGEQASLNVPASDNRPGWLSRTVMAFHAIHERSYGFSVADEPVEVVNVRVKAVGRLHRATAAGTPPPITPTTSLEAIGARQVSFGPLDTDIVKTPVFARSALVPGATFTGPAIVQQDDSTLLIPPKMRVQSDAYTNLIVEQA